ncbi:lycopene cyclase domain-containing protein [Isoptericola sp. CG 20/1183]|uniref:Lycopene cyclase domain-containing protein n=1 Tax=Isoptericola halotolerans TaxID=300560 RepID=A0ABX5EKM2_9MICO|nr:MULTISPECIES: lycopene cyclase domain-containing protein [Isoptericola]MCK0118258.1 lycopene cyclase domain-containing protein [Isoptericola sp. S6320L]PRZ09414.1 lycopene cyclase domain-containing protein [Isoptericola sp. CG 20/1183]PRZ10215.1 lycopene cyclase domain-containing protein [Isoptericola halotolerans]
MTYALLAVLVTAGALAVAVVAAVVRGLGARWWATVALTAAVLIVLTIVFDSLMIAADLFRYGEDELLGPVIWLAPVEDLAWPVVAALLLPGLWALAAPKESTP